MKSLETGKDKIKEIAELLRKETLEPAQDESKKIIHEAKLEAQRIIQEAHTAAEKLHGEARQEIEKERAVFRTSLEQSCKQSVEILRQEIERKLFNEELESLVVKHTSDPQVIANLISSLVQAIDKNAMSKEFSALIPASISPAAVNALLIDKVLAKLKDKGVVVGTFAGGVQIKLHDRKMTIDVSDQSLKELIGNYIRKDFRGFLFGHSHKTHK